jgi:hypothetical protein
MQRGMVSLARPVPTGVDVTRLRLGHVKVQRQVKAIGCLKCKTQWYVVSGGVKGQVGGVKEWDGHLLILGQDHVLTTYPLQPSL